VTCGERALGTLWEGPRRRSFVRLLDFTGRCEIRLEVAQNAITEPWDACGKTGRPNLVPVLYLPLPQTRCSPCCDGYAMGRQWVGAAVDEADSFTPLAWWAVPCLPWAQGLGDGIAKWQQTFVQLTRTHWYLYQPPTAMESWRVAWSQFGLTEKASAQDGPHRKRADGARAHRPGCSRGHADVRHVAPTLENKPARCSCVPGDVTNCL